METRKVFKTGHSIAITIPQNMGFSAGDNITFSSGENNTLLLTKTVREGDMQQLQPEIIKEPKIIIERTAVIGFVVTQASDGYFYARPLTGYSDGAFESPMDDPLISTNESHEKVIGVLPAPQNIFKICGFTEREDDLGIDLGYEFEGVPNPNWEEIYPEERRVQDAKNSVPVVDDDILADAEGE